MSDNDQEDARDYSKAMALDYYGDDTVYKAYTTGFDFGAGEEYVYNMYFAKHKNLLDLGCGGGRTTFLIHSLFSQVLGLDINERLIRFAERKATQESVPVCFIVGDATALPLRSASYDNALFSYNGIEGIPASNKRINCLQEVHRVLQSGGIFIFTTHTFFSMVYQGFHAKKIIRLVTKKLPLCPPLFPESDRLRFGDVAFPSGSGEIPWNITNPFAMLHRLRKAGFRILYVNSAERVTRGLKPSLLSFFGAQTIFYVAQKP
jgi:ubiquinone/menaquinone biosynthesis C-methylase UbiE